MSRPLRVVLADDDHDTVETLAAILRDEGHTVFAVFTGNDVLDAAKRLDPDVIILDIAMPGKSGYAIAHDIQRAFHSTRPPLLIAISGRWKQTSDKLLSLLVGFDHHLTKPCDPRYILELLEPLSAAEQ